MISYSFQLSTFYLNHCLEFFLPIRHHEGNLLNNIPPLFFCSNITIKLYLERCARLCFFLHQRDKFCLYPFYKRIGQVCLKFTTRNKSSENKTVTATTSGDKKTFQKFANIFSYFGADLIKFMPCLKRLFKGVNLVVIKIFLLFSWGEISRKV